MSYQAAPERYESMPYRRAGRSGLVLSPLSLGLWQNFGTARSFETQRAIVLRAFDLGITSFDLANNYGPPPGAAEETFGRILASDLKPYRDEILISTKAGYGMWPGPYGDGGSRKHMLASLDQSLNRLGVEHVDVFYHHRPDPDTPLDESIGALTTAIASGKATYPAVSNYGPDLTDQAAATLREAGTPLLLSQPRYSMMDRNPEQGTFEAIERAGAGAVVYSPLEQGLLTDRYLNGIPEGSRAVTSNFLRSSDVTDDRVSRARALNKIAAERGQTLAQLALTWVLRVPVVTSAIIGASSVEQLEQNVKAVHGPRLTEDELRAIDDTLAR